MKELVEMVIEIGVQGLKRNPRFLKKGSKMDRNSLNYFPGF